MNIEHMGYSDRHVFNAVRQLQGLPNITTGAIAEKSAVPRKTTEACIGRLKRAGLISRTGAGRRWGYTYTVRPVA